jgi:TPR repeat protein
MIPALPAQAGVSFLRYLEATAGQGEAESQLILGLLYRDGWDGAIRQGSALERWCQLAAEQDDRRPAFLLGRLLMEPGRIVPDKARSAQCLAAAADLGDNYARVLLGETLLEGAGVPVDWTHGAELMRQAARAGFAAAQFRLGILYLVGDATLPKDEIEALAWFIVAADAGSRPAQKLRDERTALLGREAARLAIKRSRALLQEERPFAPAPKGQLSQTPPDGKPASPPGASSGSR